MSKAARMVANEMLVSHSEEIKHLSKEALRQEIKVIVDKEWSSSDPEQLVDNIEQEICKLVGAWKEEKTKLAEFEEYEIKECTKSSINAKLLKELIEPFEYNPYRQEFTNRISGITLCAKDLANRKYEYKISRPQFSIPLKLELP